MLLQLGAAVWIVRGQVVLLQLQRSVSRHDVAWNMEYGGHTLLLLAPVWCCRLQLAVLGSTANKVLETYTGKRAIM